jgi:Meiotically up-regulated gene 113
VIYLASAPHGIKVGAARSPEDRVRAIETTSGITVALVAVWEAEDERRIERAAHGFLREHRIDGEWFSCDEEEARSAVEKALAGELPPDYKQPITSRPGIHTVTLKVTAGDRELWVEAAGQAGVSLSEWLRQAAAMRLARSEPVAGPAVAFVSEEELESIRVLSGEELLAALSSEEEGIAIEHGGGQDSPSSSELSDVTGGVEVEGLAASPSTPSIEVGGADDPPSVPDEQRATGPASSAPASVKEQLQQQARELISGREFRGPDPKPESKKKKR